MPSINVLDQETINKIAAGEVVERPSAAVKELVENSIDAKASAITVEIRDGGISLIRITDNGWGIEKEDIRKAFLRHSTSKITSIDDLARAKTLGFRGEALSSVAAVSQMELLTCTPSGIIGNRYVIEGGVEKSLEDAGCPKGTTILVRNLFYNAPVRKKFLKTNMTEGTYINNIMERFALSHPEISISFIVNNQRKIVTSGNGSMRDVIYQIYGRDITANVLKIEEEDKDNGLVLAGYIGKPSIVRGNRNYMSCFVNGRYIKSNIINRGIEEAFEPYVMGRKYPFCVLNLGIDTGKVDVNVHPNKMEVRFEENEKVFDFVYKTIKNVLGKRELIVEAGLNTKKEEAKEKKERDEKRKEEIKNRDFYEPFEEGYKKSKVLPEVGNTLAGNVVREPSGAKEYARKAEDKIDSQYAEGIDGAATVGYAGGAEDIANGQYAAGMDGAATVGYASGAEDKPDSHYAAEIDGAATVGYAGRAEKDGDFQGYGQMDFMASPLLSKEAKKRHKIIGQVFETYWIVEYEDKMFLIDQHAAHEKVLYEKKLKEFKSNERLSQVITPVVITLSMKEQDILLEYKDMFYNLGFEIEHFGGKEYVVREVPASLLGLEEKEVLLEIFDSLSEETHKIEPEIILAKLASMSCKAAVKGNQRLSPLEAEHLIDQLMELENPYNCPHGRPTIISMSRYEIERKFKRII